VVIADAESKGRDVRGNDAVLARGLERTLEFLGPREVFVVSTVPEIGYPVPQTLAQVRRLGRNVDIRPSLDPAPGLCGTGRCQVESGGRSLYFDEHQLSVHGAAAAGETLRPAFE